MKENKIALIDADSILYICCWDKEEKCYITDYPKAFHQVNTLITKIILETKSTHYLGFFSASKSFRKKEFESYKSNRDKLVRPEHIPVVREYIMDKWGFVKLDNLEADDGVCICSKLMTNTVICSPDKDILYLEGTHYNYKKDEWVTTSKEEAQKYFWMDMVTGQTGDGVKGIPGKGVKYAEKLYEYAKKDDYAFSELEIIPIFRNIIFSEYIDHFGEYKGIEEFYKNYKLLKILETDEKFETTYKELIENPLEVNINKLTI
jgi:5'-3' exonuclease